MFSLQYVKMLDKLDRDAIPNNPLTTKSVVPESVASDMSKATQYPDPDITARARRAFNTFVANDFPPGPKFLPMFVMINLQKGGTLPFCLALMMYYENWSAPCLLYTASHGTYGIVWLLKHVAFRDAGWDTRQTFLGAINGFLAVLGPYWVAPWLLISGRAPAASNAQCVVAMGISTLGMVIMIAADAQKHFTLKYKRGLITTGMFALVRHPNYAGEMLIYGGFAAMVGHWAPWLILFWVWIELFHTNMMYKEARMSRYPGWAAYRAKTGLLVPWIPSLFVSTEDQKSKIN